MKRQTEPGGRTVGERIAATHPVLGVQVSMVSLDRAGDIILDWIERCAGRAFVAVTGVHGIIEAQDDRAFKTILNGADLCVPDGMPLVWLGRLAGHRGITRVFGPDLMLHVSKRLASCGGAAFYYGGKDGVADALAREMERRFPGIRTAGTHCPPFRDLTDQEAREIAALVNRSGADILWVGLSTPKQERWMVRLRPLLTVPVMIGVGAAFDYNTGAIKRAPTWMQASGLEWLYRLIQEPRRLWRRYLRNNPLFVFYLVCERLRLRNFR